MASVLCGDWIDVTVSKMTDVEVVLADAKKELFEKGYIEKDMLVWGMKRMSITNRKSEMFFFGIKDGKFMVLPFIDIKTLLYDEVKYYTKNEVRHGFKKLRPDLLEMSILGGKEDVYLIMGPTGLAKLKTIIGSLKA
jgi:hypothetical protein